MIPTGDLRNHELYRVLLIRKQMSKSATFNTEKLITDLNARRFEKRYTWKDPATWRAMASDWRNVPTKSVLEILESRRGASAMGTRKAAEREHFYHQKRQRATED